MTLIREVVSAECRASPIVLAEDWAIDELMAVRKPGERLRVGLFDVGGTPVYGAALIKD